MDKICLIFTGGQYQSWLDNKIISNLSTSYNLEIIRLNSDFTVAEALNLEYGKTLNSMHYLYLFNQIAQIHFSKSFKFRLRRMYLGSVNLSGQNLTLLEKMRGIFVVLRQFVGYTRKNYLQILAFLWPLRRLFEFHYKREFKTDLFKIQKSEKNFIKNLSSDLIIFPTSGADLLAFELIALCKLEEKKSMFVIENWDNLTSKTTFPFNPDYITVMGERSALQAQEIHGFAKENIAITGLPRFEKYNETQVDKSLSFINSKLKQILYLGFSLPYNETRLIQSIFTHLQDNYLQSEFELHYKPHPFRQKRFIEDNIKIDKTTGYEAIKMWHEPLQNQKSLPLINEDYLLFLRSFDIVITTPTTMALEVMILGIPCIIDSVDDGIHITSPWHAMNNYLHLEDLISIPEVKIARTESEVLIHLDELMKSKINIQNYYTKEIIETRQNFSTNLILFLKKLQIN